MRLVKIALGNVNPTVGAVRSNVDQVLALAREMAADGVTVGCFPEQVVGGYPRRGPGAVAGFVAAQRGELERFAAGDGGAADGVRDRRGGGRRRPALQLRRGGPRRRDPRLRARRRSSPPTTSSTRRAPSRAARRASPSTPAACRSATTSSRFDFGTARGRGLRGRLVAGRADAAALLLGGGAGLQRLRLAVPRRRRLDPRARCSPPAPPTTRHDRLRQPGRRATTGWSSTAAASSTRTAGRCSRRRASARGATACVVDLDRTRACAARGHAPGASDCEAFQRERDRRCRCCASSVRPPTARALAYPAPAGGDFFLPAAGAPVALAARRAARRSIEALALGVARLLPEDRRLQAASAIALSGGRDSLLTLLIAWRAACLLSDGRRPRSRSAAAGAMIHAFYMPTRYSGEETRGAAATIARGARRPLARACRSRRRSTASWRPRARCWRGGRADRDHPPEHAGAHARRAHVELGEHLGALFLQTGNMSEKAVGYTTIGGDLEGALSVIANVPKTVVMRAARAVPGRASASRASARRWTPSPARSSPPTRPARRS